MTSSLVGSEMCIRDRVVPFEFGVGVFGVVCFGMGALGVVCFGMVGFFGAVSYTHLTLPTICSV
eukprot:11551863-Prorocentrum_lima.AAC.1